MNDNLELNIRVENLTETEYYNIKHLCYEYFNFTGKTKLPLLTTNNTFTGISKDFSSEEVKPFFSDNQLKSIVYSIWMTLNKFAPVNFIFIYDDSGDSDDVNFDEVEYKDFFELTDAEKEVYLKNVDTIFADKQGEEVIFSHKIEIHKYNLRLDQQNYSLEFKVSEIVKSNGECSKQVYGSKIEGINSDIIPEQIIKKTEEIINEIKGQ